MAKKRPKQWGWSPSSRASSPTLDAATKTQIAALARELIDKELKPRHVEPPPENARFNYLTDITTKWHGSTPFLVAVDACPGPNALSPSFESRFARLKPVGRGCFDLHFMRYTGQWVPLYQGLTLDQCLEAIRDDPWFTP
ncbi:MAG TPA: hypothetical protein VG013_22095 [Gemmataceae bacterium]|jgi:hypothetical protein|nr:hypothetical protein [Gemmataceae bacterium]